MERRQLKEFFCGREQINDRGAGRVSGGKKDFLRWENYLRWEAYLYGSADELLEISWY